MPTIQVEVQQCGSTTSAADIRGHQIVVDRPKGRVVTIRVQWVENLDNVLRPKKV